MIKIINNENFEKEILKADKPILLDFYATWCGPCQMLSPIIEELSNEHPEYCFAKVNVDENTEIARAFKVASIPMLLVFKNGEVTNKAIGLCSKEEILDMFR